MLCAMHRVNTISQLEATPKKYGVEVDIRTVAGELVLNHEPFQKGDRLDDYLAKFDHGLAILEIKEEGIEKQVIALCKKHKVENYFLLSVSFPFIYQLSGQGIRKMALRYSEFESIDTCLALAGKVDWVWVDTFTKNPLDYASFKKLKAAGFKICLVSPDRWGRPQDIPKIVGGFKSQGIRIDAVMTDPKNADLWQ